MTSATGSQSYVAVIKQVPATPRTIPATPVMQKVNFASDDMGTEIPTKVSDHIRPDRMTTDITPVGYNVAGGYDFEFQFENSLNDEIIAGFLWTNAWSTPIAAADLEGGAFTLIGAILDLTAATVKPTIISGQKLYIENTTASGANDGIYTLTTTGTNTYTVVPPPAADETFGVGVTGTGSMIRNGVFYQPFFIERGHTDIDQYFKFIGMGCNVLSLEFADESDVVGSYQFMGLTSQVDAIVETGATYTAPATTPVFYTSLNIPSIAIDGVVQSGCLVKEMTLEINNNLAAKTGLGVLGACETKAHRLSVTGALTMYFEDATMYDRLLAGTAFSIDWIVQDVNGNGYAFSLPKVKLDADTINVTGVDDEVMDDATFVALADDVTNCMIQIDKF